MGKAGWKPAIQPAGGQRYVQTPLIPEMAARGLASDPCRPVSIVTPLQTSQAASIGACPLPYSCIHPLLMPEMTHSGYYQRHSKLVSFVDRSLVLNTPAGLDDGGDAARIGEFH